MSERGRSPSSATSSPGGSPSRHPRARQSRVEVKPRSPRTPPRHVHTQKEHETRDKKGSKASRTAKGIKKIPEKKEDLKAPRSTSSSPCRRRTDSQSSVRSQSSIGSNNQQCVGVAVACDGDAAELFDQAKVIKKTDTNSNKMNESRTSQISDSGVESMDSEKLKSKVNEDQDGVEKEEVRLDQGENGSMTMIKSDDHKQEELKDDAAKSDEDLSPKCESDEGNNDNDEGDDTDTSPPEEPLESKYDLLPCATGKDFLGVLGYRRIDLIEDEKDVMASSIICTDGSDVEALSEVDDNALDDNDNEKDSSDSIEVLDPDNQHVLKYTNSEEQLCEISDADGANLKTLTRDGDHCSQTSSQDDLDDLGEKESPVPLPVDAVVELRSTEPGALLGKPDSSHTSDQDSDSHIDSDTSDGVGATGQEYLNYEDVMSQLIYGYTKMTDSGIDQFGASGISRPDSLCLPRPMHRRIHRSESNSSSVHSYSSTEALIEAATCTPLHAQGTVDQEGEMIAFVAQDLAEKIRMSSPLTRSSRGDNSSGASYAGGSQTPSGRSVSSVNSMSSSASGWSTSSASGWSAISTSGMSRSPSLLTQSPEDIPPIDPRAVLELEMNARRVAENLDHMMYNLKGSLNKMSSLTVNCVGAYTTGIDNTCDSVDGAIKSMYALMAKCEELSKNMKPIYHLADQIKEIKRLLDLFEAQISREEK